MAIELVFSIFGIIQNNMKRILLGVLILQISFTNVWAQATSEKAGDGTRTYIGGTYLGTFQPGEADATLMPELQLIKNEVNKSENETELKLYKDSVNKLKIAAGFINSQSSNKTTGIIEPEKTFGFNALANQSLPSDNSIAVGNDGKMIAAVNSSLRVYNPNGSPAGNVQFFPLFWDPVTPKNILCDPLVFYDANVDRFIVFTQVCDKGTADNRFLMAFSTTNDPSGQYHYYSFRANLKEILGSANYLFDVWFDYPKMAVSKSDVFVTGNLFRNTVLSPSEIKSDFVESAVFQIDKMACFAGSTNPTALVFNNLVGAPFTLVPAGDGLGGHYGEKMHMAVTTRSIGSSNTIRMYTVDTNVQNQPNISTALVSTANYDIPADGVQQGSNVILSTNDSRGMSAMYVNGMVHFVFHCNGPNNYVAINYSRLVRSGTGWALQNQLISTPGIDCAYPAVASMAHSSTDQSALIVYNYSGFSHFPGTRAVFINHDFVASNFEELFTGTGAVTVTTDPGETRWGDYCGIARKHNEGRPTVWGFSTHGNSANRWSNHISEIKSRAWIVGTKDVKASESKATVYPNPVINRWSVNVDITKAGKLKVVLYDLMGKKVKDVFEANVSVGESEFSFNKNGLAKGSYIVKIFLNEINISNEKIVVAK